MFWVEDFEERYLREKLELEKTPSRQILETDYHEGQNYSLHSTTPSGRRLITDIHKHLHPRLDYNLQARTSPTDPINLKVLVDNAFGHHGLSLKTWTPVYKNIQIYSLASVLANKLERIAMGWAENTPNLNWNVRAAYHGHHFQFVGRIYRMFEHGLSLNAIVETDMRTAKQNSIFVEAGNSQTNGGVFFLLNYHNLAFEFAKLHGHYKVDDKLTMAASLRLHKSTYMNWELGGQYTIQPNSHSIKAKVLSNTQAAFTHIVNRQNWRFGWSLHFSGRHKQFRGFGYRIDLNI